MILILIGIVYIVILSLVFYLVIISQFILLGIIAVFLSLAFYIILRVLQFVLEFLTKKLEGDNSIMSILVWWGIIFFIVGNALQLWSTFLPQE